MLDQKDTDRCCTPTALYGDGEAVQRIVQILARETFGAACIHEEETGAVKNVHQLIQ